MNRFILAAAAAVVLALPAAAASADTAAAAPPASTLQVSAAAGRYSVSADGVDVGAVLTAVYERAGGQFTLDSGIAGTVTMRVTDQSLDTVLDLVCRQCYLKRAEVGHSGVTLFSRDDDAVRRAFAGLRALNGQLDANLTSMGLGGGGAAGLQSKAADSASVIVPRINGVAAAPGNAAARQAFRPQVAQEGGGIAGGGIGGGGGAPGPSAPRFVSFNIPVTSPKPVVEVLHDFARQSGIDIVVDPDLPNTLHFRLEGRMSPRPVTDALNALAPPAHLEWRWVGDRIFVTSTPDFRVQFGAPPERTGVPHAGGRTGG